MTSATTVTGAPKVVSSKRDRFPQILEAAAPAAVPTRAQAMGQAVQANLSAFLEGEHGHADLTPSMDKSLLLIGLVVVSIAMAAGFGVL